MGNWQFGYDGLSRLVSGTVSGGTYNGDSLAGATTTRIREKYREKSDRAPILNGRIVKGGT
jgi:hypothetical protein